MKLNVTFKHQEWYKKKMNDIIKNEVSWFITVANIRRPLRTENKIWTKLRSFTGNIW